jgi:hypothetical protein
VPKETSQKTHKRDGENGTRTDDNNRTYSGSVAVGNHP